MATNYGENASLKYYQTANGSASAQAKTLLEAYREYCSNTTKEEPPTLAEYMNERGYDPETQDALLSSVYDLMREPYKLLDFEKRCEIKHLLDDGYNNSEIADKLGVSRATIGREIKKGSMKMAYIIL